MKNVLLASVLLVAVSATPVPANLVVNGTFDEYVEKNTTAYSADCDRLVRPIVITDSEHCDHSSERSDG